MTMAVALRTIKSSSILDTLLFCNSLAICSIRAFYAGKSVDKQFHLTHLSPEGGCQEVKIKITACLLGSLLLSSKEKGVGFTVWMSHRRCLATLAPRSGSHECVVRAVALEDRVRRLESAVWGANLGVAANDGVQCKSSTCAINRQSKQHLHLCRKLRCSIL